MIVNQFPNGAIVQPAKSVNGKIKLLHVVAVVIARIGDRFREIALRDVLGTREEAVAGIAEKVHALVPRYLAHCAEQADAKLRVFLIATAFLPLTESARVQREYGVSNCAAARAGFEIIDGFVEFV